MARHQRRPGRRSPDEPDSWPAFFAWLLCQGWLEFLKALVLGLVIIAAIELLGSRVTTDILSFVR
jgi:hypothetical protein